MTEIKCLACYEELANFLGAQEEGKIPDDAERPVPEDAVTFAPAWQTKTIMGQMVMACIALPSCERHLVPQKRSAVEQSVMRGGVLIPGAGNGPPPHG
jgi:hypothetical protein